MKIFTTAAAALAVAGFLVAANPASADTPAPYAQTITDPTGDVVAEDTEVSNVLVKRSVGIAAGADASGIRVSHTPGFLTVQFSAPNLTNGSRLSADLRASGRKYSFYWRYSEARSLFLEGTGPVSCASTVTRTFGTTDRATVKIPRSCLGNPATVSTRATLATGQALNLDCRDRENDFEGRCTDPIGVGRDKNGTDESDARWTSFLAVKQ